MNHNIALTCEDQNIAIM